MTSESRILGRAIEVRPAGPGRPSLSDKLEVVLLVLLFVVALATPLRRADGAANAPGEAFFQRWTGGSICIYRRVTGIPCPGCGLSHGFVELAHGELVQAVSSNPLTPVIFLALLVRLGTDTVLLVARREVRNRIPARIAWKLWGAFWLCFIGLGVYRVVVHFVSR